MLTCFAAVFWIVRTPRCWQEATLNAFRWTSETNFDESLEIAAPPEWESATHLIMVAGHAVYIAGSLAPDTVMNASSWLLESYQYGQLPAMIEHIRLGVDLADADEKSLLVFSGGETRAKAGPRSEALSYWEAADAMSWFGTPAVRSRAVLEPHARDSFENLMFSICRFREATGKYPRLITAVSFDFKRSRFVDLHRVAIRFPADRFDFVGADPPDVREETLRGEQNNSANLFGRDPYGCSQPRLRKKRASRNPFRRSVAYTSSAACPEMAALLRHCGPTLFSGSLPWD